jgi:2-polyprenyl-6-methoxyphenol hydroxylase-like FAD-dependent oxidoreductase
MNIGPVRHTVGIIGAALAGPTFALQILSHPILRKLYRTVLYDQRENVQSLESAKSLETAGAAVAVSVNGLYPLHRLGLKDAINEMSTEVSGVNIWRASGLTPLKSVKLFEMRYQAYISFLITIRI